MTNPTPLSENELKALAYFAVGVTSEGSIGGRDVSYRLSFAGNVGRDGVMDPVGNSGYSFGTLQIDLGQHPDVARDLLAGYQSWAALQPDHATLALSQRESQAMLTSLQRTGHQMEAAGAHDIDRTLINRFLASDAGRTFVHGLDCAHVNGVTTSDRVAGNHDSALERLQRTALYTHASDDDQARLAGIFMKLQNQSGEAFTPGLLRRVGSGELSSAADVKTAVDGLRRNAPNGSADYIESGADNTLRGAALFNSLRAATADNPLSTAWNAVVADPLIGPVAAHANTRNAALGVQYDTIRSLFLTPEASQRLVHTLDHGGHLAEGDPSLNHGRRRAGSFVSGHDFVHWNADGQGVACVGGHWRSVDPDNLRRTVHRDGSVDLTLTEDGHTTTLVHVDPRSRTTGPIRGQSHAASEAATLPARSGEGEPPRHGGPEAIPRRNVPASHEVDGLRAAQVALSHLGYTGADGKPLRPDGLMGPDSRHAIRQFQSDHGLEATAHVDERTRDRLAAAERTMASSTHLAHALYAQSLNAVQVLDRRLGIPGGPHSIALAGVAAAEAARAGLTRVDRVDIGNDRAHVQAVQFVRGIDDWATNRTTAPITVALAVAQPLDTSSQQAAQAIESQRRLAQQAERDHAPMRLPVL